MELLKKGPTHRARLLLQLHDKDSDDEAADLEADDWSDNEDDNERECLLSKVLALVLILLVLAFIGYVLQTQQLLYAATDR